MDSAYYIGILQDHLIPAARRKYGKRWRYQQDNDPKHRSGVTKQFLEEEVPEVIDWPSNSPDANPVENLWAILERCVEKRRPSNIDELEQFLNEEWKRVEKVTLVNLIRSMTKRCQVLIDSRGERINY
jgi:transposase